MKQQDYSYSGDAYKRMLRANAARTEESGIFNTNWKSGSLDRLEEEEFNYEEFGNHWDEKFGKGEFARFEKKWNDTFNKKKN
jgi:hypothetical protein